MERTTLGRGVFLSYRSRDRAVVEEFAGRLRRDGIDAWYDGWEIAPGDDIVARMDEGIDHCGAGLIFVSRAWFEGPWAQDEYTSLAFRKVEDDIRLISVMVEDVADQLPARLRKLARRSVEDYEAIRDTLLGVDRKPGLGSAHQHLVDDLDQLADQLADAGIRKAAALPRRQNTYREIVRDFLPANGLEDRETELAELRAFCSNDEFYQWWQGKPWAGKSALMASFMLDPREDDVVTVGFFVRVNSPDSDRYGYAKTLVDQLCALLDEDRPPALTRQDAESVMLDRLYRVAELMWRDGKRLVLVVDGLDEDRDSSASIAARLPRLPVPGLKVLVTSRLDPHLPEDVKADHPLQTCRVRKLARSPQAQDDERAATQEINQALREGGRLVLDVLGMVAASIGGLSQLDLAALVNTLPFQLEQVLVGRFGRSLVRWVRFPGSDGDWFYVYEFAHKTLRVRAVLAIGTVAMGQYRERIHAWAQQEWANGWSTDTPTYLLYTYPHLLRAEGDLPRLLALTSQPARQQRMYALGHAMALAEVTMALDEFAAQPDPGPEPDSTMLAVTRLAERRAELLRSAPSVPINLPAVWAILGDLARAESLVDRVGGTDQRDAARALIRSALGDDPRQKGNPTGIPVAVYPSAPSPEHPHPIDELVAADEVERAIELATSTTDRDQRLSMMTALVKALVRTEAPWRGWDLAEMESVKHRSQLCSVAVREAVQVGRVDLARQWVGRIRNPERKGRLWAELVPHVCAAFGVDAASAIPKKIRGAPHYRAIAQAKVALAVARTGDLPRARMIVENAEKTATEIGGPAREQWLVTVRADLVEVYSAIGDLERAQSITQTIDHSARAARALVEDVAPAAYAAGDTTRMKQIMEEILTLVSSTSGELEARHTVPWALAVARGGDPARAQEIIEEITDVAVRQRALADLAAQLAQAGDRRKAAQLAIAVETAAGAAAPLHVRLRAVVRLAFDIAQPDTTDVPFADAEAIAHGIDDDYGRANSLGDVARALAKHDYRSRALAVTGSITYPYYRTRTFLDLVQAIGDDWYAQRALAAAKRSIHDIPEDRWRVTALSHLIPVLARHDRDEVIACLQDGRQLAGRITEDQHQSTAWAELAEAASRAGHRKAAIDLTKEVGNPLDRTRALIRAATAAAGSYDHDAYVLADRAHRCAHLIAEPEQRVRTRSQLVELFVRLRQPQRASVLTADLTDDISMIGDPALRAFAEADRVAAVISCGDHRGAESLAASIEHPYAQAQALSAIAKSLAKAHQFDDAQRVCALATYPEKLTDALLAIALELANCNDMDGAERITLTIAHAPTQAKALVGLALKHTRTTAWRLAVRALLIGDWADALPAIAHASPTTARLLIGDYALASHG